MGRLFRQYNQNKLQFWIIVIIIALLLILIHVLNGFARQENQKRVSQDSTTINKEEQKQSQKLSEPMIDGKSLNTKQKSEYIQIIDNFINSCKNAEVEKAYSLLSDNCKSVLFPTKELFEKNYINNYFQKNNKIDYELWNSSYYIIYKIYFYEDMLTTGKVENAFYEDYYTIIKENNVKKINVNSYINRKKINKSVLNKNINIDINYVDIYKDYYIFNVIIKNNSNNDIILDTRNNTNSVFIENNYGIKFPALLYEIPNSDLIVNANKEKTIEIKFSNNYNNNMIIKSFVFSDVVLNSKNIDEKEKFIINI